MDDTARALAHEILTGCIVMCPGELPSDDDHNDVCNSITSALRTARSEALEEAASREQIVRQSAPSSPGAPPMTNDIIATLEGLRDWLLNEAADWHAALPDHEEQSQFDAWADALDAILAEREWRPTHHHIKSGGLYQVIARGIDATNAQPADDREVVIYRNEHGQWFCRIVREFDDGRFVAAAPQPPKGEGDE